MSDFFSFFFFRLIFISPHSPLTCWYTISLLQKIYIWIEVNLLHLSVSIPSYLFFLTSLLPQATQSALLCRRPSADMSTISLSRYEYYFLHFERREGEGGRERVSSGSGKKRRAPYASTIALNFRLRASFFCHILYMYVLSFTIENFCSSAFCPILQYFKVCGSSTCLLPLTPAPLPFFNFP